MNFYRNQNEIIKAADHNLAAAIRYRMQNAPRGRIFEQDGILTFSIGHPVASGHLNGVLRINSEAKPEQLLDQARTFFRSSTSIITFWIREQTDDDLETALQSSGLKSVREPGIPCMILPERLAESPPPENVTLTRVTETKDAADYGQVMTAAFGLSQDVAEDVFGKAQSLSAANVVAFVARRKKRPIAASMVIQTGAVAGIYYVGTIPEARGQGLGELCTRAAADAGFDLGADAIVLQASVAGEPLYRRMGFQPLTRYKWYRFSPTAAFDK